jgi:hypothetical protein
MDIRDPRRRTANSNEFMAGQSEERRLIERNMC